MDVPRLREVLVSIEGILIGLLAIGAGAAWAFFGLRFFAILLPIWAFFFGIVAGVDVTHTIFGDGFFATVLSWGIGLAFGVVLALISYFWYYAAVTLAVGIVGYALGAGLVAALGIDSGFLSFLAGLVVGGVFAVGAFVLAFPVILVIVVSAASGAAAVVNGVLIFLGTIKLADLDSGIFGDLIKNGVVGTVAWIVIAVAAIVFQMRDVARVSASMPSQSDYRY
jgi:hypothetical protein